MADTNTNMTVATTRDYWISPNALHIERNAMSNPDYIQASCVSGAQILVYIKDIISYDAGHNYRRWSLQASPTVFNTHTEKYVYVAIPRDSVTSTAMVVFPSELLDIYGKNEKEEQIGSENYYYIFLQGILSSSGDNGTEPRDWLLGHTVHTGYLSSDEAINAGPNESEWFQYSSVDGIVTFLKDLTVKAGQKFRELFAKAVTIVSGGYITFEGQTGELKGIANTETPVVSAETIVTPKYMDDKALSKSHNDKTDFDIELKNLRANGAVDIFGNLTARSGLTVGRYTKGIEGAHVDFYGNAEFESIAARSFLEVPELRYNRTTITVGNRWQTQGAGIIEKVWAGDNADNADIKTELALTSLEGVAKLKLEDGEVGAIALDDKCQGVFHFIGKNNDPSTTDSKDGNFHFAGFTTIYFLIKEIYTADTLPASVRAKLTDGESISENQFFRYELRAATCAALPAENRNRWTDTSHPQPAMNFAAYANATNADRQASRLTTTTYQLNLAGMTDWTYTQDNIMLIIGWLDGFSFVQRIWDNEKKEFVEATKELHGEGIGTGNIYMWGKIDQFDRAPSLVAQQLYFHSSPSLAEKPDGISVDATHTKPSLNGWQKDPITPSPTDRFVWQQWLYSYSDGTYTAGEVTFLASDPTAFTLVLDKNIISVAVSDWYDPANPDDIEFNVSAQVLSGVTPVVIKSGTAAYSKDNSDNVTLGYQTTLSDDGKTINFHVRISGFVGVGVDGVTPEDAFVIFTAETSYGTATATATIAQNREGEAGESGVDAVSFSVSKTAIVAKPSSKLQIFTVYVKGTRGNTPMKYQEEFICSALSKSSQITEGLTWSYQVSDDGYDFLYRFVLATDTAATVDIPFTITDVTTHQIYQHAISFTTVSDGENGKDGENGMDGMDGMDAVSFSVSQSAIMAKPSTEQQTFTVHVKGTRGNTPMKYSDEFTCSALSSSEEITPGLVWGSKVSDDGYDFQYVFTLAANAAATVDVQFVITDTTTQQQYLHSISFATVSDGSNGVPGMIVRYSEWHEGAIYHNDEDLNVTLRYLDIVTVTATDGTFEVSQCRQTHTATADNKPSAATSELWVSVNKFTTPIYTPLIIAANAVLRFGQTNRFLIMDTEGKKVQGCITGVDDPTKPMAWFGGETASEANFSLGYDGTLTCRAGTFNNINVQSGKIAGFKVSGNGLTNDPYTNDAYVVFRNDNQKAFAGIGGNVLSASSALRAVARFENEDANDYWGLGANYAMILSAKNGNRNYAFYGSGNGILDGWIGGFAFHKFTISAANKVFGDDLVLNMYKANQFIIHCDYSNSGVALPKLSVVRKALDVGSSTDFCIKITVMADLSNKNSFSIYGRNKIKDSSGSYPWNVEELPLLTDWNGNSLDDVVMVTGDSVTIMLIYDSTRTQTISDYTTKYTARIINRQD